MFLLIINHVYSYRNATQEYPKLAIIPSSIPWMPTLVHRNGIFLGRAEQAEDSRIYQELGLTHVLSIGRYAAIFFIILNSVIRNRAHLRKMHHVLSFILEVQNWL